MYARPRCHCRGIRCESGTVPQRCDFVCFAYVRRSPTPADGAARSTVRVPRRPGLAVGPVDAVRPLRCLRRRPRSPRRPRAERGRAPRDHRASRYRLQRSPSEVAAQPTARDRTAADPDGPHRRPAPTPTPARSPPPRCAAATPPSDEAELRGLATEAAAGLISEDPAYSRLAARLLTRTIADEAAGQGAVSFSASVAVGHREGLIADRTAAFVRAPRRAAGRAGRPPRGADDRFGYFGLRTLYSRYCCATPSPAR